MTRETTIEHIHPQTAAEAAGSLAMEGVVQAAEPASAPTLRHSLGRLATVERYQPIRQVEPGEGSDDVAETPLREPRAVLRFGGQTLLDTISDRLKSARRPGHSAIRGRSS